MKTNATKFSQFQNEIYEKKHLHFKFFFIINFAQETENKSFNFIQLNSIVFSMNQTYFVPKAWSLF